MKIARWLGLILLLLSSLLAIGVFFSNTDPADAAVFGVSLSNVSIGGLFLAGAVTGIVAMLGLFLMLGGTLRRRHKTVTAKRQMKDARGEAGALQDENARLQAELERERAARPS